MDFADLNVPFANTPTRRVIATVLKSPLQILNPKIHFSLPPVSALSNEPIVHDEVHLVQLFCLIQRCITILVLFSEEFEQ